MSKWLNLLCALLFLLPMQAKEPEKAEKDEKSEKSEEGDKDKDKDEEKKDEPPKTGNFALPTSQQPAGLFAFGGNIIDKDEIQCYLFGDAFKGSQRFVLDVIPGVLYGLTDELSVFFNVPYGQFQDHQYKSRGLEDCFLQFEYAFYDASSKTSTDQATVVTNMTFPSGSIRKNPPTGFGSPSFFLGGTYYHTTAKWVLFTAQGGIITTSKDKYKVGDAFLSQYGIARNLKSPKGWIYAAMFELDGQYSAKNREFGIINKDSGGTAVYLTPSLWVSSKNVLAQFGVSFPLYQHWFGKQKKFDFALNCNFAWSFYPEKKGKEGEKE